MTTITHPNFPCSLGAHLGTHVHVHQVSSSFSFTPLPENVGAALELLLPLALNLEVVGDEGHFLQEHNQARTHMIWHRMRRNQFRLLSGEVSYECDENEQPSAWRGPGTQ